MCGLAWYVPHAKREAVNACRFEVSKKWNDVLDNACIQTWSPFYNKEGKNAFPTCDESDLISDSTPSPWMGYIWNSKEQRYEWLLAAFKTVKECQLSLEKTIGTFSYTGPVGCTYSGNILLRVRIMNALYGGANYTSIAETAKPAEAEKIGMRYSPAIGPVPTDHSWRCVDASRDFKSNKGPAFVGPTSADR